MTHKLRGADDSASLMEKALRVLLRTNSDLVCGDEACEALVSLTQSSTSLRRVVTQWATQELREDITRGHEAPPIISVRALSPDSADPSLSQLLLLLRFQYATNVRIPVPRDRHGLPDEQIQRLRRQNDEVQRVIQGCRVEVYAAFDPSTGWGIYAAQRIPRGEYVGEYTGELVSSTEASRRYEATYDRTRLNYVLSLRERTAEGSGVVRTNVDATRVGCYTRFFNHSCEPTLRMEALRVDSFVPRLVLFTRREMAESDQLTYDYGSGGAPASAQQNAEEGVPQDIGATGKGVRCQCGAATCRGVMPFDRSL